MSVKTEIERLNAIKNRIRTNLVAQGITVPADTMLDEMATMILSVAGEPGYTPVKFVDYWTEEDQEAMVQDVLAALGMPVFGTVDLNKVITLKTDSLADGTYKIGYDDKDGKFVEIGIYEKGASYTNLADPSSPDWANGYRMSSAGELKAESVSYTSNYIPMKAGDVVRVRGMNLFYYGASTAYATQTFFDANKSRIATINPANNHALFGYEFSSQCTNPTKDIVYTVANGVTFISGDASKIAYARFTGRLWEGYKPEDVIITVNQEITD